MNARKRKFMEHCSVPEAAENIPLSSSHCNALSVRMRGIEEDCREINRWLEGLHGIYEESIDEPAETTRRKIKECLAEILALISTIKADLGLRKKQLETTKVINAHLAHLWETVHESKSTYLKGYGAVPEELRKYIDARTDEILSVLKNLAALLPPPLRSHDNE